MRPIFSHLDRTNLVNKGFIIWLLVKFCMRDTAGSPERARWFHLACSGSQSQRAIWFILPARGASHIILSTRATQRQTTLCKTRLSAGQTGNVWAENTFAARILSGCRDVKQLCSANEILRILFQCQSWSEFLWRSLHLLTL